jgi:single-strand DNA-binding protein
MSTQVTLRGRLVRDPDLTYSQRGTPVARFAVVTSRNIKNRESGEWEETGTTFWETVAFGQLAENCAESLVKGTAVIVQGNAAQEEWETREGEKRRTTKVTADDVAPSLRWATATVKRAEREKAGQSQSQASGDAWASEPPF